MKKKLSLKKITIAQIDNAVRDSLVGGTGQSGCPGYTDQCGGYPTNVPTCWNMTC